MLTKLFFDFNRDGLDNSSVDDADLLVGGERSLSHRYENIVVDKSIQRIGRAKCCLVWSFIFVRRLLLTH